MNTPLFLATRSIFMAELQAMMERSYLQSARAVYVMNWYIAFIQEDAMMGGCSFDLRGNAFSAVCHGDLAMFISLACDNSDTMLNLYMVLTAV